MTSVSVLGTRTWPNTTATHLHNVCDILKQPCSKISEAPQSTTASNIYSHAYCKEPSAFFVFLSGGYFLQPNRWLREFTKAKYFFLKLSAYMRLDNITKEQFKYLEGFVNDGFCSDSVFYIIIEKLITGLILFATSTKSK